MSFDQLYSLDVNSKTEKKKAGNTQLTYLSWAFAWAEFVKVYPDATYEILKNEMGLPYFLDARGAMVYTKVTANGLTHEMWLPVMNGANKAMRANSYTYDVIEWANGRKTGNMIPKDVEALTMFDVNKTVMRCLVKNLAMFGLGLYIYAGEDLPEPTPEPKISDNQVVELEGLIVDHERDRDKFLSYMKIKDLGELNACNYKKVKEMITAPKK